MAVPLLAFGGFLYHVLDNPEGRKGKKRKGEEGDSVKRRFWLFMSRCTSFILRSQFLSVLAAGFFITVNVLIMVRSLLNTTRTHCHAELLECL